MFLPKARNTDIVVQPAGKELLIYDLTTHKAFNLNETSKIVFESCDGKTPFEELKHKYKFTDDLIYFALDELKANDLIAENYQSKFDGFSRREVIKKVGLASMVALPVISSLVAPSAIQATSCVNPGGASSGTPITSSGATAPITLTNANVQCCSNSVSGVVVCTPGNTPVCVFNGNCR